MSIRVNENTGLKIRRLLAFVFLSVFFILLPKKALAFCEDQVCSSGWYGCIADLAEGGLCGCCKISCNDCPESTGWCGEYITNCNYNCGCRECETCTPRCGQPMDCGGNCGNQDNGGPAAPTIVSPNGTISEPTVVPGINSGVTLSWVSNSGLTNRYGVEVINNVGTTMWHTGNISSSLTSTTSPELPMGVYHWRVRGINTSCDTDYGTWSTWGYFWVNPQPLIPTTVIINPTGTPIPVQVLSDGVTACQICDPNVGGRQVIVRTTFNNLTGWDNIRELGVRLFSGGIEIFRALSTQVTTVQTIYAPTPTPYSWDGISCADSSDCGNGVGQCIDSFCESPILPTPTPQIVSTINPHPIDNWQNQGGAVSFYREPSLHVIDDENVNFDLPLEFDDSLGASQPIDYSIQAHAINEFGLDISGSVDGWADSGHSFRVWSCLVPIVGTLYDGTDVLGGPVCGPPSLGFSNQATAQANFTQLTYRNVQGDRSMVLSNHSNYSSQVGNHLIWGQSYNPVFNTDFNGTAPIMRLISTSTGTTQCGTDIVAVNSTLINPFSDDIGLRGDFSSIVNQEQWFQILGGGAGARNQLINNVPVTCPISTGCTEAISVQSGPGLNDNGMIMAGDVNINSGCGGNCQAGSPNDWMAETPAIFDGYNYEYFYNAYYMKNNKGVVYREAMNMSQINSDTGSTGVVFVDGNLTINEDVVMPSGQFLMINVNGLVTINNNVNRVDGIILADGGITTPGESDNQLVINGMLFSSGGNIRLNRSYINHVTNNSTPSVLVRYNPALIFRMPGEMVKILLGWKEGL